MTTLQIDSLSEKVLGRPVLPSKTTPYKYSGELFGVLYLYAQSGEELPDEEVDEGFEEHDEQEINSLKNNGCEVIGKKARMNSRFGEG